MYLFVKRKKTKQKLKINKLEKFILRVLQNKKQKKQKKQTQRENITPTRPIGWAAET